MNDTKMKPHGARSIGLITLILLTLIVVAISGCTKSDISDALDGSRSDGDTKSTLRENVRELIKTEQKVTIVPTESDPAVIITTPEDIIEPGAKITAKGQAQPIKDFVLSQEELEKLKQTSLGEERSKIPSAFRKMRVGETYVFGLAVRNIYHYDAYFTLKLKSYIAEQKEGMSFVNVKYPKNLEKWFENEDFLNFKIEKNSEVVIPIAVRIGNVLNAETPTMAGSRITYNFELMQVDSAGGEIEIYSYEQMVLRVI